MWCSSRVLKRHTLASHRPKGPAIRAIRTLDQIQSRLNVYLLSQTRSSFLPNSTTISPSRLSSTLGDVPSITCQRGCRVLEEEVSHHHRSPGASSRASSAHPPSPVIPPLPCQSEDHQAGEFDSLTICKHSIYNVQPSRATSGQPSLCPQSARKL